MISIDYLLSFKDSTDELAKEINSEDIAFLVDLLNEKNDDFRYPAFLTLQKRSRLLPDVYKYFDTFVNKMDSDNSYQRSIGIILISENIKWDKENKFDTIANKYISHCNDEKFITARQTIQSINTWLSLKPNLFPVITDALTGIDVSSRKDTQRKLLLMDILTILSKIQKAEPHEKIIKYMLSALSDGYLDAKSIKLVKSMFE